MTGMEYPFASIGKEVVDAFDGLHGDGPPQRKPPKSKDKPKAEPKAKTDKPRPKQDEIGPVEVDIKSMIDEAFTDMVPNDKELIDFIKLTISNLIREEVKKSVTEMVGNDIIDAVSERIYNTLKTK